MGVFILVQLSDVVAPKVAKYDNVRWKVKFFHYVFQTGGYGQHFRGIWLMSYRVFHTGLQNFFKTL